jgi:hypothetical protein
LKYCPALVFIIIGLFATDEHDCKNRKSILMKTLFLFYFLNFQNLAKLFRESKMFFEDHEIKNNLENHLFNSFLFVLLCFSDILVSYRKDP